MLKHFLFPRLTANPSLEFLERREHFVPFRVDVLMERILADNRLSAEHRLQFQELRKLLAARFHFEYYETLESLKRDFVPFDEDRDTLETPDRLNVGLDEKISRLYEGIKFLLARCNFVEMTAEQLDACLELQPIGGLSVFVDKRDFSKFDVFFRGIREKDFPVRRFLFFKWVQPKKVFSRVFVIARMNEENGRRFFAKMFKDVLVENLKIVVPKVRLGMPIFDRLKIGGTVFGSLATTIVKVFSAFMLSWWLFAVVLSSLVMAAFKGILSFLSSKTKYLHVFSSSLYYLTVSNNEAALTSLVDAAEEQELKEALLAYYMLFVLRDRSLTMEQLDEAVEDWLADQFGWNADFEVDDAVCKLEEKGLLVSLEGIFKAYDLPSTLRRLDKSWDEFFTYNDSGSVAADQLADGDWPPFPVS